VTGPFDPSPSVAVTWCAVLSWAPCWHASNDGGHGGPLARRSIVVPGEGATGPAGLGTDWERIGNGSSLRPGTPDRLQAADLPESNPEPFGERSAQPLLQTSAGLVLTPGLTWPFACVAGVGFEPT